MMHRRGTQAIQGGPGRREKLGDERLQVWGKRIRGGAAPRRQMPGNEMGQEARRWKVQWVAGAWEGDGRGSKGAYGTDRVGAERWNRGEEWPAG